jgi:hypothetical protein
MTRLPANLRAALYTFIIDADVFNSDYSNDARLFDLTAFLAEALLSADDNDRASERAGHHNFPGLACMFERLDECLDHHRTASEVRQSRATRLASLGTDSGKLLQWFDAP